MKIQRFTLEMFFTTQLWLMFHFYLYEPASIEYYIHSNII